MIDKANDARPLMTAILRPLFYHPKHFYSDSTSSVVGLQFFKGFNPEAEFSDGKALSHFIVQLRSPIPWSLNDGFGKI
jgi:hypothetical protein